jgi:hypothetical protein
MVLPGAPAHPPAKTEVEAQNQIVQLLFTLIQSLNGINASLHNIDSKLQMIGSRMH